MSDQMSAAEVKECIKKLNDCKIVLRSQAADSLEHRRETSIQVEKRANPDFVTLLKSAKGEHIHSVSLTNSTCINSLALHPETGELFIVTSLKEGVYIYDLENEEIKEIAVPGMKKARGMVYYKNFLYITNQNSPSGIYKVNLEDSDVTFWDIKEDEPYGLSIHSEDHLLVSIKNKGRILIYTTNGDLEKDMTLGGGINGIYHAIMKPKANEFIACQSQPDHRLVLLSSQGEIRAKSDPNVEIVYPFQCIEDELGRILVADSGNNRLRVFNSALDYMGHITYTGDQAGSPRCFEWQEDQACLLIGDDEGIVSRIQVNFEK